MAKNSLNKILDLEREKAKKGHEKSSNFTKIGKIKKKLLLSLLSKKIEKQIYVCC